MPQKTPSEPKKKAVKKGRQADYWVDYNTRTGKPDTILDAVSAFLEKSKKTLSFQEIFEALEKELRTNKTLSTITEENLRLRLHDKIQRLIKSGVVIRTEDRKYKRNPKLPSK